MLAVTLSEITDEVLAIKDGKLRLITNNKINVRFINFNIPLCFNLKYDNSISFIKHNFSYLIRIILLMISKQLFNTTFF